MFDELCDLFLDDAPKRLTQIGRAIEGEDARTVQAAAHAFKGAASVFEAAEVVALARHLEHLGGANDLSDAASHFSRLERVSRSLFEEILTGRNAVSSCRS